MQTGWKLSGQLACGAPYWWSSVLTDTSNIQHHYYQQEISISSDYFCDQSVTPSQRRNDSNEFQALSAGRWLMLI